MIIYISPTIVTHKFTFKKTLHKSSCGLKYIDKRTPSSSSSSTGGCRFVRSFGEFPKKKHDGLSSTDTETMSSNRKGNGRLTLLTGSKNRLTIGRHHSVQYNKENEQSTKNDQNCLDPNKVGKENLNVGLRRNTVGTTTSAFKSIRTRGLMELRKSNKNNNVEQTKKLKSEKSKSIDDSAVGLIHFRKLTLDDNNVHKITDWNQIQIKSEECVFQCQSYDQIVDDHFTGISTSQESDLYICKKDRRLIKWSVLESTKMMTALFFDELPIIFEKEINNGIAGNEILSECYRDNNNNSSNEKVKPYYSHRSVISLPRSAADEQHLGEFYLNHERVQQYLKLRTESLHLAVSLVDQYTWRQITLYPSEYQLLGVTAIFIAVKFVERFPPATKILCYLTEDSYNSKQVLDFEFKMLEALDFDINIPLPHHFLDRAFTACNDLTLTGKTKIELVCRYLFELNLTELSTAGTSASVKCAAGVYLARELIRLEYENGNSETDDIQIENNGSLGLSVTFETWPKALGLSMGHEDVTNLLPMVLIYVQNIIRTLPTSDINNRNYEAAFHKFSNRSYGRIAQSSLLLNADYDFIVQGIRRKMISNSKRTNMDCPEESRDVQQTTLRMKM
ncbi:unnamed protein product [Schistosoma margrebowiei]|uniref:Cyclin-like domain-containing protein n=1 Tax=Schistosoma margrebowiei TaxID=48269 RepID=A0A3P8DTF8_9TREM|nr:unnamed protein product [Schistosoma margrebowiei]